jgi:Mor family transcriptional regulator
MINPTKLNPHPTSEIVAYHKGKRIFLSLTDMEKENPDELQICEFKGQNFCYLQIRYRATTTIIPI